MCLFLNHYFYPCTIKHSCMQHMFFIYYILKINTLKNVSEPDPNTKNKNTLKNVSEPDPKTPPKNGPPKNIKNK